MVWGCECRGREGDEEGDEREGEGKREGVVHDDQMRVFKGIGREIMTKRVLGMFTQPVVNVEEQVKPGITRLTAQLYLFGALRGIADTETTALGGLVVLLEIGESGQGVCCSHSHS